MRTTRRGGAALAAALCAAFAAAGSAAEEIDGLPPGEGREDAYYTCVACHSFQVVSRQGMSRSLWDDTLTLMTERHGMIELDPEQRGLILDYLAASFPPGEAQATGGRRGWVNPFAP